MINRFLIVYSFLLFDFLYGYKVAKYVAREYLNSCEFSCEYHDYFCSDEMMMNMDCRLSAMSYCNTYLNYDTNGEISSQEFGCIVNCEKLLYFENYRLGVARNCKTDGKKTKELFRRPILDNTVPICECYVTEEKPKLSVPYRVKIGLYLFFFFLGGYIFVKLCTGSSGKKSYISVLTKSKDDEERSPMISDDNQVPYDEDDDDDDEDSDIEDESMENKSMKSVKMEEGKQSLSPTGNPNARPQSLDSSSSIYPSHRQFTTPSSATTRYGLTTPSVELTYTTSPRSTPNDPIIRTNSSQHGVAPLNHNSTTTLDRFRISTSTGSSRYGAPSQS